MKRLALALALLGCGGAPAPSSERGDEGSGSENAAAPLPGRAPTAAERAAIEPLVETAAAVRHLSFRVPVPVRVSAAEEIAAFVQASIEEDELERVRRFYVAVGMLDEDLDVAAMLVSVMGEQVVGFYDPERDVMVIRDDVMAELGRSRSIDDLESTVVLIHEYVHALQDQNLELSAAMERERSIDADNAFSSVVEGDATLAMIGHVTSMAHMPLRALTSDPSRIRAMLAAGMGTPRGDELSAAPPIVRVPLLSHYFDGLLFCGSVHGQRDWAGVDELFRHEPASTEQVLHPERFFAGELPETIPLPALPTLEAAGFTVLDEDTLGELEMSIFLGRGRDRDANAGEGWGGDRLRVYVRGDEEAAVWFSSWDAEAEAVEAAAAMAVSPRPGERTHRVGRAILFVAGLDDALAADVTTAFDAWAATLPAR